MRLQSKLAVITAAASGMGRAGCEAFLREGADVCAIDINAAGLDALKRDLDPSGGRLHTIVADCGDATGSRDSINEAADKLGGLDILWAHAGIPGPSGVENLDVAEYQQALTLNIQSATFAAGEAIGHMRKRGGGAVVFTASVSGLVGSMFSPVYSSCKFAVVGLTKSLAQTFAPDGVRVNAVCPGLAETPMKAGFVGRNNDAAEAKANEEKYIALVPLKRLCRAEEAANAVLWLASDEASYVTGVALPVDGGFSCK
ncbi:SDR family NAD(P)-dependent oxidoreductase [Acuticoccus sp. I52.16.1]|uniref:SDR family NAD(P)-dependent oxidoreductase n=1 Tax=Acuticoccus sp. I52.16.1 TaxID=2928472 RepID=UPI001FD12D55|nr:SDR family NAD(P)-dependent oxidoreductase [Acuticoccus sp. I52.16.1]UOM35026.1 SDR family oxidoreductase [Acuticoccus sp. I52.16.1]